MAEEIQSQTADLSALRIQREPEGKKSSHWVLWTLLVVLLGGGAALLWYFWNSRWNLPSVRTARAVRISPEQANAVLTSSGYLVPRKKATLGAQVSGRLIRLHFDEGSKVKTGDLLAEIDPKDYEARRDEARANLADALRELERQKNLLSKAVGTQQAVDAQQTRADVYKAQLELAEFNLKNTNVYAPFDGVVIQKMAEAGEMLSSAAVVVSGSSSSGVICVLSSHELEFEADVNETNLSRIQEGQEAEIILDAFMDRKYTGQIRLIQPKADRQKAVVQAKVRILKPTDELRPEMGGKVTFLRARPNQTKSESYIQIPKTAVVERTGKSTVFILSGDHLLTRSIEIRKLDGDYAQVSRGLEGGEQVVLSPGPEISEGAKVKTQE